MDRLDHVGAERVAPFVLQRGRAANFLATADRVSQDTLSRISPGKGSFGQFAAPGGTTLSQCDHRGDRVAFAHFHDAYALSRARKL